MKDLIVADVTVRIDTEGRYCLNDLHKAAGGDKAHQPSNWIRTRQAVDLIEELTTPHIVGVEQNQPLKVINGGDMRGTYVCKELVYAYAMWISAQFHIKVIRAYDSAIRIDHSHSAPLPDALLFFETSNRILSMSETSKIRGLNLIASEYKLPQNLLPSYTSEPLAKAVTWLLQEHGIPYSAKAFNKQLEAKGFLVQMTRPGKGSIVHKFWKIPDDKLHYGKNETSVESPRETQPLWYVDRFNEVLIAVNSSRIQAA